MGGDRQQARLGAACVHTSYAGECLSHAAHFSPTLADFSPTLTKFLFSARIYIADQPNSYTCIARKRNMTGERTSAGIGGLYLSATEQSKWKRLSFPSISLCVVYSGWVGVAFHSSSDYMWPAITKPVGCRITYSLSVKGKTVVSTSSSRTLKCHNSYNLIIQHNLYTILQPHSCTIRGTRKLNCDKW